MVWDGDNDCSTELDDRPSNFLAAEVEERLLQEHDEDEDKNEDMNEEDSSGGETKKARSTWEVVKCSPEFTKLWVATMVSNSGDWFTFPLLIGIVYDFADGTSLAPIAISLYFLSRTAPVLLFSSFGGVLLDRFNRKSLLVGCTLLRALLVPLYLVASAIRSLSLIFLISFLQFTLSAVYEPGESAMLPSLLDPEDAIVGNTLVSVSWSVICAIGAMVGGLVTEGFGQEVSFAIDGLSFLVAAILLIWIRPHRNLVSPVERSAQPQQLKDGVDEETAEERQGEQVDEEKRPGDAQDEGITYHLQDDSLEEMPLKEDITFMEGLRFAWGMPLMLLALSIKLCMALSDVSTILSVVATEVYPFGDKGVLSQSLMWTFYGVGAFTGSRFVARFSRGHSTASVLRTSGIVSAVGIAVSWLFVFVGVLIQLPSPVATKYVATVCFCVAMFCRAWYTCFVWINSQVMIQLISPDSKLGRMFGFDWIGLNTGLIINFMLQGALMDILGLDHLGWAAFVSFIASVIPTAAWLLASYRWQGKNQ